MKAQKQTGGKKVSENQVALRDNSLALADSVAAWGKREIRSTSIIIPQILKMELMSDFVAEGKAKFGDFVDSLSGLVLGNIEKPLVIIPIEVQESWVIYEMIQARGQTTREFKEMVPVTASNENWGYKAPGVERDRMMNVYCLLESDVKALPKDWYDKGLRPLPKIFSFRRTSLRAGKKLYTQMYITNESKGLTPPAVTIEIIGKKTDGDKGQYITLDTRPGRMSNETEVMLAFHWFKAIRSGTTKVDEPELKGSSHTDVPDMEPLKY